MSIDDIKAKRRRFMIAVLIIDAMIIVIWYSGTVWVRGAPTLAYLRNADRRTQTQGLFRADAALGYGPVAGSSGAFIFPEGMTVPVRFDGRGFRIPLAGETASDRPSLLTLGCSYAFGDAVPAEQTFTSLVSRRLGLRPLNAAVSGYGLAQMTLLAERLIAAEKPRLVLIEYAPWLVDRAVSEAAPSALGDIPTPYFTGSGDALRIAEPVFTTNVFDRPFFLYGGRSGPRLGAASFFFSVSLPYYIETDVQRAGVFARRWLGRVPPPSDDRSAVIRGAYTRMARAATAVQATVIVVALSGGPQGVPPDVAALLTAIPGITLLDAESWLIRDLATGGDESTEAYRRRFAVWAGTPPRLIDPHPNQRANEVIAAGLAEALATARQDG